MEKLIFQIEMESYRNNSCLKVNISFLKTTYLIKNNYLLRGSIPKMSSPEDSLDPKIQNKLYEEGATFVFLDVPSGTEFGIDMSVFYVGEKFRGVKMIPPGLHFIYYSAVSKHGQSAARTGFFHKFRPKGILVRKWNKLQEAISDEIIDEEETERYRSNLQDMDRFLGPYPYKMWRTWVGLTSHITESLLHQLQPEKIIISSASQLTSLTYTADKNHRKMETEQSTSHPESVESLLPDMKPLPGTAIRFTNIPNRRHPDGASPAEITKHSLDSTYNLEQVLSKYDDPVHILGELQMAFVCFLVGHVFEAFEQWQKLVRLLCTCDTALEKYTDLYLKFIVTVYFQLKEIPKDYFVDIVSKYNFLTSTFQIFFSNLANSAAEETLRRRGCRFKENLTKMFKWDFDSEPDDCSPVIVDENAL